MKKLITIDFDDTLCYNDNVKVENEKLIKLINSLPEDSYEFYIVTARNKEYDKIFAQNKIDKFVKKYKLPIEKIVYTDGKEKGEILKKLKSKLHVDNDLDQIKSCKEFNIKTIYLRNL